MFELVNDLNLEVGNEVGMLELVNDLSLEAVNRVSMVYRLKMEL